jgi:O-antigen/teichoic acid export membrane protein
MSTQGPGDSSLTQKVTRGTAWTLSFRLVDRVIGFASTLVLVRVLSPEDFGIVAMAMTLITFLEILTLTEFSSAIIQHPSPSRDYYDSAFTLSLVLGAASTIAMLLLAQPIATFFREPRLAPVVMTLSVLPLLDGMFNMGCVDFRKYMQFQKDFIYMTGRKLGGLIVVIPLAFVFKSYWALVGGMIAGRFVGMLLSYFLHPFRPRLSVGSAGPLFRFSRWVILNNGLSFMSTRGAHLIIGRMASASALGTYTVAYEMASLPTTELAAPINRVVFPAYSKLSHEASALRHGFLRVLSLIALVAIPAGLGMAAVAHLFVPVVLGSKWAAATPVIEILAVAGAIYVVQANIESLYFSLGRPRFKALITFLEACLFLPLAYFLLGRYGLQGVAYAFLTTVCISVPVNFVLATRMIGLPLPNVLAAIWRPIVAGATMASVVVYAFPASKVSSSTLDNALLLAGAVIVGIVVYAMAEIALWLLAQRPEGAEQWAWDRLQPYVARLTRQGHNRL